ncbi:MAG TPA: dihydroxy-acid dehydratase [Polyangiaceae bacterium]|nr:dihydroxy-acid dehydratase [Polyangiaceae bacterium]
MGERKSLKLTVTGGDPLMGVVRTSIMKGTGMDTSELGKKPLIAVANSHSELTTGHSHLHAIGQKVKDGIIAAGGIAVEFNVPAPCDGVAMGHEGMRYVLAQRDLIADIVETHVRSQLFDGLVMISSCDKINPGMLMAAARLDMPSIYVSGGPGMWDIRNKRRKARSVDHKDYTDTEMKVATTTCASCGSCEILGTANTIQSLAEVLGMCLPGCANTPGFHPDKLRYGRASGERIVAMVEEGLTARKIMTREALLNAVIMDLAIGGSTNTTLHLPAIANSLGLELPLSLFNDYNRSIPTLLAISPNGPYGVTDLWAAGGIGAAMKVMKGDLNLDCMTVTGKPLGEVIDKVYAVLDSEVVPARDKPHRPEGGTVVLYGNLAPEGAVVKASAVKDDMLTFTGTAVCVNSEDDARKALTEGRIKEGNVIVIRYEGPKGGPGMPEMLNITMMLEVFGLHRTALVTDGRFSGATAGPCVGHVGPEAYDGGPIAALEDGDEITIDVPGRKLSVKLTDAEIQARLAKVVRFEKPALGYMKRYRKLVSSASRGAILE